MNEIEDIGRHVLDRDYEQVDTLDLDNQEIGFYFTDSRPDSVSIVAVIETHEDYLPIVLRFGAFTTKTPKKLILNAIRLPN